ncbi:MAG TPA: UPF0179 family protein [Methanothermococcus okinawensis]|nr:UPF0179 family protein [Methanothermococcus okinawensis]HIP34768.1 UPF0179 family protein [Methanothermococcus okinawensis]
MSMEKKITLIGSKLAKTGNEFIYCGMLKECENCKFKKICHEGMVVGRRYRIRSVRSTDHPCKIHECGVKVVEIEVSREIPMLIESRKALEGLTLSDSIKCNNITCENYLLCNPEGLPEKFKIVKVFKNKITCPRGYSLRKVIVSPVD